MPKSKEYIAVEKKAFPIILSSIWDRTKGQIDLLMELSEKEEKDMLEMETLAISIKNYMVLLNSLENQTQKQAEKK